MIGLDDDCVAAALAAPAEIRNIAIVAHIDHGKSTLADNLVALNEHISSRLLKAASTAEKPLRFLDNRSDEIERQITIKASCISLLFTQEDKTSHVMNLIDSPGHLDYNAEVSSAARLCDGALLVVDAVEGVRAQTRTVMRQIYADRLKPLLFINKIDRLLAAIATDARDAYQRLRALIEDVNSLFAQFAGELGDADYCFDPVLGNVVFGSALHGFAFDLTSWTRHLVLPKLTDSQIPLEFATAHLWGEFTVQAGSQFTVIPSSSSAKPNTAMKFVLDPLMKLFKTDFAKACDKLRSLFPLGRDLVKIIFNKLPSPAQANISRSSTLLQAFAATPASYTMIYVSKHLAADLQHLTLTSDKADTVPEFLALSRVFFGPSVHIGDEFRVLPHAASRESTLCSVTAIYALLGSSLLPIAAASAGMVVALRLCPEPQTSGGLTLVRCFTDTTDLPLHQALPSPYHLAQPIVRVSVAAKRLADETALDLGLRLLARADPAVVLERVAETGERVMACAGQEHLQKCTHDLLNIYAHGVAVDVSKPLVEIREAVRGGRKIEDDETHGRVIPSYLLGEYTLDKFGIGVGVSPDGSFEVRVKVAEMPTEILDLLDSDGAGAEAAAEAAEYAATCVKKGGVCTALVLPEAVGKLTKALIHGFETASRAGPLAGEPCRGVVWKVEEIKRSGSAAVGERETWGETCAMMTACREALASGNVRLAEPIMLVDIQTEGNLAKVQAVLGQRRAEILQSDMVEGNYSEHLLKAEIPAIEIFQGNFADALRSAARGKISWSVAFSRWRVIDDDPFVEDSVARKILLEVRKRKGLATGEKIVAAAEKQRTLTRNK